MSRKQGPHFFMGMRPTAIAASRRRDTLRNARTLKEATT